MRSQIPNVIAPDLPVVQFIPTGKFYLTEPAIAMPNDANGRGYAFTGYQTYFDPIDDCIYARRNGAYVEEMAVRRVVPARTGMGDEWVIEPERFTRWIDWRYVNLDWIPAYQKFFGRASKESQALAFFKDENIDGNARKAQAQLKREVGESEFNFLMQATTPDNPIVIGERKTSLIVPARFGGGRVS